MKRWLIPVIAASFAVVAIPSSAGAAAPLYGHCQTSANGGDNTVNTTSSDLINSDSSPAGDMVNLNTSTSHLTQDFNHHTVVDVRDGGADGSSRTGVHLQGSGTQRCIYRLHYGYLDSSTNWDDWHYRGGVKV